MPGKGGEDVDQYDRILRTMEPGLIVSVNENAPGTFAWPNLTVEYSSDKRTDVGLYDSNEIRYQITRRGDRIIIGKATENGLGRTKEVQTLEIIGINEREV